MRISTLFCITILLGFLVPLTAQAQRGGFGGPGGSRGGPPGGGFRSGGGPGGGSRGGDRGGSRSGFDPSSFLSRLDRNRNGMLDPDEMQGPARFMLDRFAPNVDKSKPISLRDLAASIQRARGSASGGGSPSGSGTTSGTVLETLVPGFGLEALPEPVPGFGEGAETFAVKVDDQDRRYAEDRFRRYDRNKDGVLTKDEISSGRWSDDPFQYDRNRDGKLTVSEMAVRYANRRLNEQGNSRGGNSRTSSSSTQKKTAFYTPAAASSSTSSGGSGDSRNARIVDFVFQRYDTNKNKVLDKDEISQMRTKPEGADKNRDGRLDRKEYTAYLDARMSGSSSGRDRGGDRRSMFGGGGGGRAGGDSGGRSFFGGGSGGDSGSRSSDSKEEDQEKRSYRAPTALERLANSGLEKDLPGWFATDDRNFDGQIAMSEFTSSWSEKAIEDFQQFDGNGDGVITANEAADANKAGKVRGTKSPEPAKTADSGSGDSGSRDSGSSSEKKSGEEISERYMASAVKLIKKYDGDKDGALNTDELAKVAILKRYKNLDDDGDGRVTPAELAKGMLKK